MRALLGVGIALVVLVAAWSTSLADHTTQPTFRTIKETYTLEEPRGGSAEFGGEWEADPFCSLRTATEPSCG